MLPLTGAGEGGMNTAHIDLACLALADGEGLLGAQKAHASAALEHGGTLMSTRSLLGPSTSNRSSFGLLRHVILYYEILLRSGGGLCCF